TLEAMKSFNLRQLRLRSGEQYRDEVELDLEPFELGGERYLPVPGTVPAELEITKAATGTVFQLGFTARLHGPCYRCLDDAVLELQLAGREYQATNPEGSDELRTQYLVDGNLDLSAWARDILALALPDKILCRADCAGLCPMCGKNLNTEPHEHEEERTDSRWAALESLREQL
ncbi:MAG: YceD family protein, partial [Gaiellaceae bacterium]